jgi:diacylglycerol kinase family enzyme
VDDLHRSTLAPNGVVERRELAQLGERLSGMATIQSLTSPAEVKGARASPCFIAIANHRAGAAGRLDLDAVENRLKEKLADKFGGMRVVEPEGLDAALREIASEAPQALIVLGGDGTARAAAKALMAAETDIALVPLPGGTMNVLPRLVFGHDDLNRAIDELDALEPGWLPAGMVGGEPFFLSAAVGFAASLARLRESLRKPRRWRDVMHELASCMRASTHALRGGPEWKIGSGRWHRAHTLIIAVASVARIVAPESEQPTPREFEVASLRLHSHLDALRLGGVAFMGNWRDARQVEVRRTKELQLRMRSKRPMVVLDGEPTRLARADAVAFAPRAVRILQPVKPLPPSS